MTQVVAFDVNETLLDLRALDEPFEADVLAAAPDPLRSSTSFRHGDLS